MMVIRFHPVAERELFEAFSWYEHQRKGLGADFLLCIDESIERLKHNPQSHLIVHKEIRRIIVRRFPFAVFFEEHESEIRIVGVFHSRRDPGQWLSRK